MDQDCTCGKIYLSYTEQEWQMLEEIAQQKDRADFRSLLTRNLSKLAAMNEVPYQPVGGSICRKGFMIPSGTSCQLVSLSQQYGIPLVILISRFVVSPLIRAHYEEKGLIAPL